MKKIGLVFCKEWDDFYKLSLMNSIHTCINLDKTNSIFVNIENASEVYNTYYKVGQMLLNHEIDQAIIIEDYGTLPFMILAKIPRLIVAQISDEHSAHMTIEHNNTNVLCLSTKLNSKETIIRIIDKFINASFEGERHQTRLDMLEIFLKKEKQ